MNKLPNLLVYLLFLSCAGKLQNVQTRASSPITQAPKSEESDNKPQELKPVIPKSKPEEPKELLPLVMFRDEFDRVKLELLLMSTGRISTTNGNGTIICIEPKLMLTASHVPEGECNTLATDAEISFFNLQDNGVFLEKTKTVKALLVKHDSILDLALYQIDDPEFSCVPMRLADNEPNDGNFFYKLGFNLGWIYNTGVKLETKILVENGVSMSYNIYAMQANHGGSGGPMVSASGELVGVAVGLLEDQTIELNKKDGTISLRAQYVTFAVTLENIKKFLISYKNLL